jgi:hypothetical protein
MGSTFVYAALAFDELGEGLSIGLKTGRRIEVLSPTYSSSLHPLCEDQTYKK